MVDVKTKLFEYRFHVEELSRLEVACPMSVDYMRSKLGFQTLLWKLHF